MLFRSIKDDTKLIAQAICEAVTHVLTEDKKTLAKDLQRSNVKRAAQNGQNNKPAMSAQPPAYTHTSDSCGLHQTGRNPFLLMRPNRLRGLHAAGE